MAVVIVTGSAGLIGNETASFFHDKGFDVIGIDNNFRKQFFGDEATTAHRTRRLTESLPHYRHYDGDVRDARLLDEIFERCGDDIALVVHTAAQPSHDWAAKAPVTDFSINAVGTLNLLEAARRHSPEAVFIYTSTNKVYGDAPNRLPLVEHATRWELDPSHPYAAHGIDENLTIDHSTHSLFGVSKTAGDLLVQEYGRYFGMKTGVFRGGCLTGSGHAGTEMHGFLSYLVKCAVTGRPYKIFGYKGKQVRDNLHAVDLVNVFWHFFRAPKCGAVYNIGGSRRSNCSVLEAIDRLERLGAPRLEYELVDEARKGDHIWWISDVRKFQSDYPEWRYEYDLEGILDDLLQNSKWTESRRATFSVR